ncbi:hypothetical protein HQ576_10130 [bacterium]|nr:hypothetical protein [bacterium]
MTATSWHIWFVTASSITEAQAGRASHITRRPQVGRTSARASGVARAAVTASGKGAKSHTRAAHTAHSRANTRNPIDHTSACAGEASRGSMRKGKLSRASREPTLDNEYRRYVRRPGWVRLNQAWSSGLVVASTK